MKYTLRNFPQRIVQKNKTLSNDVFPFEIRSPAVAKAKSVEVSPYKHTT